MEAHVLLLKFIAKASLNAVGGGVAGDFVMDVLPGIARDVWGWWGKDRSEAQRRAEVQALAAVPSAEMSKAVKQAVAEAAADKPADFRARLENFVGMVPGAIHQTLRRPSDPRGVTVPSNLPLQKAEDLLQFLPQRLPRFKPGDRPLAGVDWELVKLLGVGGFGEVWRARNPHVPAMPDVALKFCLDLAAREQLLKYEAAMLGRIMRQGTLPGIVPLRHTYLTAATPCLEYEFIDGGDLASAIFRYQASKGLIPPEIATKIVLRLARAVGHVHKLSPPIVHRDLKPANILVRKREGRDEFLIADFGIGGVAASQALEQTRSSGTSQPMMTSLKGSHTPLYASPEQKRGEPPDPRDDVHALGVIWYQLLIGDFSEGAPAGGAWRRTLFQRGMTEPFLSLLESCFEARAEHRPANAGEVAERIEAILAEKAATKPEPPRKDVSLPPSLQREQAQYDKPVPDIQRDVTECTNRRQKPQGSRPYLEQFAPARLADWRAAAERGSPGGQWLLARCLQDGIGVQADLPAAAGWFRKAAEQGFSPAQNNLGRIYQHGSGLPKDEAEALRWLRLAAEQGDPCGQFALGSMYDDGIGVPEDEAEAVRWYRRAAEQGEAHGQYSLGRMYALGSGVGKDKVEAVRWYRLAAEQGSAPAQCDLGSSYAYGEGPGKDEAEAVRWYRLAAEQGYAFGQSSLGFMYEEGRGVAKDEQEAVRWYSLGAEQGNAFGQFALGAMYADGRGVPKDSAETVRLYRLAAEQDYSPAQYSLGCMYLEGNFVPQNKPEAAKWFRLAAEQGDANAKKKLSKLSATAPKQTNRLTAKSASKGTVLDKAQTRLAVEAMRVYLAASSKPDGRTLHEVSEDRDRERVVVIESQLQPLLREYLAGQVDLTVFKTKVDGINKRNQLWGFQGIKGQMFFNMLVKAADDQKECDRELKKAIAAPANEETASSLITTFVSYVKRLGEQRVKAGGGKHGRPKVGSIPFFLSYFWQVQERKVWPVFYTNSVNMMTAWDLWQPTEELAGDYLTYKHIHEELAQVFTKESGRRFGLYDVEHVFWFKGGNPITGDVGSSLQSE